MKTKANFPWLAAACAVLATVPPIHAGDIHVPADYPGIQGAVNAAVAGDTIHIAPGIYTQQIFINNKNLTLIGQPGTILRASPGMLPGGGGLTLWRPLLFVYNTTKVTLRGLTFEGDQLADQQGDALVGVLYRNSGATVEHCRFSGFREKIAGTIGGLALRVDMVAFGLPPYNVNITDNVMVDSYTGIAVRGHAFASTFNVLIANNTIEGVGPSPMGAHTGMRGIDLGGGVSGTIISNSISQFAYVDDGVIEPRFPFAWGIIAVEGESPATALNHMRFENNTLISNNLHMVILQAHDHDVINNRFQGSAPGDRKGGLWFTGNNVKVQNNVFEDMEVGIRAGGNDGQFGTDLGIANAGVLTDNRFCNVGVNIAIQPMATVSETGTLTCPFPPPALTIGKAALLCWPEIEQEFVVEGGPTPEGPWTPVDAPLFKENGNHCIAVPTTTNQMYFRLVQP